LNFSLFPRYKHSLDATPCPLSAGGEIPSPPFFCLLHITPLHGVAGRKLCLHTLWAAYLRLLLLISCGCLDPGEVRTLEVAGCVVAYPPSWRTVTFVLRTSLFPLTVIFCSFFLFFLLNTQPFSDGSSLIFCRQPARTFSVEHPASFPSLDCEFGEATGTHCSIGTGYQKPFRFPPHVYQSFCSARRSKPMFAGKLVSVQ